MAEWASTTSPTTDAFDFVEHAAQASAETPATAPEHRSVETSTATTNAPSWQFQLPTSLGDFAAYAGAFFPPAPASDGVNVAPREDAAPFRNPVATPQPTNDSPSDISPAHDRAVVRASTGEQVGIAAPGHSLRNVRAVGRVESSRPDASLPYGLFAFEIHDVTPGGSASVQMTLPENARPSTYLKEDRSGQLQRFDFDGTTGAEIDGNVVTLHFIDGGRGDADGVKNGVIVDPGGPGGGFDPSQDAVGLWPVLALPGAAAGEEHRLWHGFGDAAPFNLLLFHEGIDIIASGNGGEKVIAARAGKVVDINPDTFGGFYILEVTLTDGSKEWDVYLHIDNLVQREKGEEVERGANLGKISTTAYAAGSRHLHYMVTNVNPDPLGPLTPIEEKTILNPLMRFRDAGDRDPWQKDPRTVDSNVDDREWLFVPQGIMPNNQPIIGQNVLSGKIDIVVDALDPMSSTAKPKDGGVGPHAIGYYILSASSQSPKPHGVKTSKDNAYMLAKFDDKWFAGEPFTNGKFPIVYFDSQAKNNDGKEDFPRVKPNATTLARNMHYILTNSSKTTGAPVDAVDAFWHTKAKELATPRADDHEKANYADLEDEAAKNAQARFMDGQYYIIAVMSDLRKTVEVSTLRRLANFERQVGVAPGPAPAPPVGQPTNADDPDIVVEFDEPPPVVVAPGAGGVPPLSPVAISGDQFYPDWLMDAYIFPHQESGWVEGQSLSGAMHHSLVRSDATGLVAWTDTGWLAPAQGMFDVIIDYNNNGKFDWKLDAVGSFNVVVPDPEPLP